MTRRYTNPAARPIKAMQAAIRAAIDAHPEQAEFAALQARYSAPLLYRTIDRIRVWFAQLTTGKDLLTLRAGRSTYRLKNNPATLSAYLDAIGRCPGWTGRATPKAAPSVDYGRMTFTHADGWALAIPAHWTPGLFPSYDRKADSRGRVLLRIGHVVLNLRVDKERGNVIEGEVPASWLVDLNAGPIVDEGANDGAQLELAA